MEGRSWPTLECVGKTRIESDPLRILEPVHEGSALKIPDGGYILVRTAIIKAKFLPYGFCGN